MGNLCRLFQVIHMVTSAKGAEEFYTVEDHAARGEGLEEARMRDTKAAEAWVGHPYVDVVDNTSDFEHKINVLIAKVKSERARLSRSVIQQMFREM